MEHKNKKHDSGIFPKYEWLARYHNDFCIKYKLNDYTVDIDL